LIDQWRDWQDRPQAELARRARMYPGSLARLSTGRQKLSQLHAERLAGALSCDVQQVLAAAAQTPTSAPARPGPPWRRLVDEALSAHRQSICGFADAAGISRTAVFDMLRGARRLSPAIARHMVEQLGIDLLVLLTEAGVTVLDGHQDGYHCCRGPALSRVGPSFLSHADHGAWER
jgi:plasmid maintenance system antidote protein VapI